MASMLAIFGIGQTELLIVLGIGCCLGAPDNRGPRCRARFVCDEKAVAPSGPPVASHPAATRTPSAPLPRSSPLILCGRFSLSGQRAGTIMGMDWDSITINGITLAQWQVFAILGGACFAFIAVMVAGGLAVILATRRRRD